MDRKSSRSSNNRSDRSKKRYFRGNRFTGENDVSTTSASAAKIAKKNTDFEANIDQSVSYDIINFSLFMTLQSIVMCKICQKPIRFSKRSEKGLGFLLSVQCKCQNEICIPSSPQIYNTYEINRRFVFVMRLLGVGLHGIKTFLGLMDIGKGFTTNSYYKIIDHIWTAVEAVSQQAFRKAAKEEVDKNMNETKNHLSVSGDGSWAKRGFSSLLGVTSLIGKFSGKIIDVIVKSSVCKSCEQWYGKEDTVEYAAWYETHAKKCTVNHSGSAGLMEVNSIIEMFPRSVEKFGVCYKYYIGDGDTKTFKSLQDVQPYGDDLAVEKKECVLHVKKRMYKRVKEAKKKLTQLKKAKKALEEKEAKKKKAAAATKKIKAKISVVSTKRKSPKCTPAIPVKTATLTNKLMRDLSLYYGLAILRNKDSVEEMQKAIWSTYYHKISTDANPQHSLCPVDFWCKYRKAEAANTLKDFTHPPALDQETQEILEPIYKDLSSEDLLKRCVGANTQNNNESYNACVWQIAPKHIFSGKKIVEIAAFCAASVFNEGLQPVIKMMETMGILIGVEASNFVKKHDEERISKAERMSCEESKEQRVSRRNARLQENEFYEETEGIVYGAGIAD